MSKCSNLHNCFVAKWSGGFQCVRDGHTGLENPQKYEGHSDITM